MSEYKPSKQSLLRDENKTLRTENARLTAELAELREKYDEMTNSEIRGEL